jgi:hypothetical protein
LVPLGGATSLVTTNLPDARASLNGVGIECFLSCCILRFVCCELRVACYAIRVKNMKYLLN